MRLRFWLQGVACVASLGLAQPAWSSSVTFQPPPPTATAASTPVAPNGSVSYSFDQSGTLFQQDFDDSYDGTASNDVQYWYSGLLTQNGQVTTIRFKSDTFTANSNASGSFVGFLGVGRLGEHSDAYVAPTIVAYISDPNDSTKTIGYVKADYDSTQIENTTFTAVSTSSVYGFDEQFNANDNNNAPNKAPPEVTTAPEPAGLTLMAVGFGSFGLAFFRWRKRQLNAA